MDSNPSQSPGRSRPYAFGFVLNTTIGNMTRYRNLRKYTERDPEVEPTWAPVSHYTTPELLGRLRWLPPALSMRIRVLQQSAPVMRHLDRFDAVMIHLFEADNLVALRSYLRRNPVHVSSTDEAPITDRKTYPLYPNDLRKSLLRQKLRLAVDRWRIQRTDLFIPFSRWAANILNKDCGVPEDRLYPLHVGLDLEVWRGERRTHAESAGRIKILFVGADFRRKGGELLLDVFRSRFLDRAELHFVTKQAPTELPPHVYVYSDFQPNDSRLAELYSQVDMLVVPTTADVGPIWVFMEAMAMRLPVIGTNTGANLELVRDGDTGAIVKIGDGAELAAAIQSLIDDPALRNRMGERGRKLVEANYSAAVNVPLILGRMKAAVDARR